MRRVLASLVVVATDPHELAPLVHNRYLNGERCTLDVNTGHDHLVVVDVKRWQNATLGVQIGVDVLCTTTNTYLCANGKFRIANLLT